MAKKIRTPYKKGARFTTMWPDLEFRIMAIADNYAMVRYTRLPPFTIHLVKLNFFLVKIGAKLITR